MVYNKVIDSTFCCDCCEKEVSIYIIFELQYEYGLNFCLIFKYTNIFKIMILNKIEGIFLFIYLY